jgi:hypothetical protein
MHQTLIQFPEIHLERRDGHKLRGYFANLFGEESDHFHNHDTAGKSIVRYPLIQYKVVHGCPTVLGIAEGGKLLVERFLRIDHIDIDGLHIQINQKNIQSKEMIVGVGASLFEYEFINPWMALNEKNYDLFQSFETREEKTALLERMLTVNMLHFFSAVPHREEQQILVKTDLHSLPVKFKNQNMLGFKGKFTTNVQLPDFIGFGKSVSRGFGTIQRIS